MCSGKDRRYASLRISYLGIWCIYMCVHTRSRRGNIGTWRTILYVYTYTHARVSVHARSVRWSFLLARAYAPSKFQFPLSILSWWQCVSLRTAVHHPQPRLRLRRAHAPHGTNGKGVVCARFEKREEKNYSLDN